MSVPLSYVTYNVGNASANAVTDDLFRLTALNPAVIGLNEVGDRKRELDRVVRQTGYRLVRIDSTPHHPNSAKTAALVHPAVKVEAKWLVTLSARTYVGKKVAGARKDGHAEHKYILALRVTIPGDIERVVGIVHFVPSAMRRGNWQARRLHARQVRRTATWLAARKRPALVMGDMNAAAEKPKERRMLRRLEKVARLHHVASHGHRHIDIIATRIPGEAHALDGYSSDHRPVQFTER